MLNKLNEIYRPLSPEERIARLYQDFDKILFTSSFGTSAAYLLQLVNRANPDQIVHFIDTSFHFPETLRYKEFLEAALKLKVVDLKPNEEANQVTRDFKVWETNPDMCCDHNKVRPIEKLKQTHQVWISGVMGWQSPLRAGLNIFEESEGGLIKFHPIIDVTREKYEEGVKQHQLPGHPLEAKGYDSIGCTHCTAKGKGRSGRWKSHAKTECGLHVKKEAM